MTARGAGSQRQAEEEAAACAAGLFVCGLFGLWEQTMQTLALMLARARWSWAA